MLFGWAASSAETENWFVVFVSVGVRSSIGRRTNGVAIGDTENNDDSMPEFYGI